MSEYMREIIYMKRADHGRVTSNRSFARLESRDNELLLHLSVQESGISPDAPVYLVYRKEGELFPHQLGTLTGNTLCDFCCHMEYLPHSINFKEICGLLVGEEDCYLSGSCRSEANTILYSQVRFSSKKTSDISRVTHSGPPAAKTLPAEPEPEATESISAEPETVAAKEHPAEPETVAAKERPAEPETVAAKEHLAEPETVAADTEKKTVIPSYLNLFKQVYPFEDNELDWCVKLEPDDFVKLPMEYWHYQKNSFLLMGFYNFHHLLYAHKGEKDYIAVPGQFCRKEQYIAGRFGFSIFKGAKRKRLTAGDFGYWMKEI